MSLIETEALILKSYNLAEADKIILLLTRDAGLVRGVARGAKRLKSRFGGSLEPFSVVNLTYFQKEQRELVSIRQIDLIKSFFTTASAPEFLQKFAYLVDILTEFAPPHDPNERLFRMVRVCLETSAETPQNLAGIGVYFELWLLRLGGYLPDWSRCHDCKKAFGRNQTASLQVNFHLTCSVCRKLNDNRLISPDQRQIFISAQMMPPDLFASWSAGRDKDLREISIILKRVISHILGREVTGEKILFANN